MSKVIATKKNREDDIIFNYFDMSKKQALKRAKDDVRELIKSRTGKRMWGWTFKVK